MKTETIPKLMDLVVLETIPLDPSTEISTCPNTLFSEILLTPSIYQ